MREIDVEELKKIQIEILDEFDAFCRKHGLYYWLDYGTLIGAIRHKGYIPWDDDVDIGMLREDYEKAAVLFNQESNGLYRFFTPENNDQHRYSIGKLVKTNTVLYEYGFEGVKTGVYVDVFPYDNCPVSEPEKNKIFRKRDFLGRVRRLQLPIRAEIKGIKRICYIAGSSVMKVVPGNSIEKKLDKNARKYENLDAEKVCLFVDPYDEKKLTIPKKTFQHLIEVEFENKMYFAPAEYDYWLSAYYGEYMTLPPVEERKGHHVFKAYYLDE